jgi:hypothetical protein
MSFAVTAVSKKLVKAGLDHIITESGRIIVDVSTFVGASEVAEAYDPMHKVKDLVSVKKDGKTWIYTRSKKKMVTEREYYSKLMKLKRAAGYKAIEKKLAKKREGKAKDPDRVKSAKTRAKAPTKGMKEAAKKAAPKKTAKPVKKAGKKRMV